MLLITGDYPHPTQPTRGVFNLQLVQALSADHQVTVVSPRSWYAELRGRLAGQPALQRTADLGGATVHYPRSWYTPGMLRQYYAGMYWWSIRRTVEHALRTERPDVVLAYWAHPDGAAAVRAARQAGVPAVVIVGGSDVLLLTQDAARRACIVEVLHQADAVVTVGRHLRRRLLDLGVRHGKIRVVPRGVDEQRFFPDDRAAARARLGVPNHQNVLVWVGRMAPVKGLDVLLAAVADLAWDFPDAHLYLVGDGALRPALEADCRQRGLSGRVHFVGAVKHGALPDWYRAADVTVLPSRSEGVPNVLRESLACGTPFVASAVGGIPELGDEQQRILVLPDDVAGLAGALAEALTDPLLPGDALERLPTWQESAAMLMDVIEPLLPQQRTAAAPPPRPAVAGAAAERTQ